MIETAWVIQRNDGKFYAYYSTPEGNPCFTEDLLLAFLFRNFTAEEMTKHLEEYKSDFKNCKPVKVEIRVVE